MQNTTEKYLQELRQWLAETAEQKPEEMRSFFEARLEDYEEHMSVWKKGYEQFADMLPERCKHILDLGCGTGLELDELWKRHPDLAVTGVDLSPQMQRRILEKHPDKQLQGLLELECVDYFQFDLGQDQWDAVISFESLHHFFPEKKQALYQRIFQGLKNGGVFLLGDYTACCEEEETLLRDTCLERRARFGVPDAQFIHFDIPLTIDHETELMRRAGFAEVQVTDSEDGVTLFLAQKI